MPNRLETYDTTLEVARGAAQFTLLKAKVSVEALGAAKKAVTYLKSIENDSGKLRDTAATLETVTKLLAKVGPLKVVMEPLKRIISQIEERADDVEKASEKLDSKFGPLKTQITLAETQVKAKIFLLENAIDEIDSVHTGIEDAADASVLAHLPTFAQSAVTAAFDTVLPAQVDPLLNAINRMEDIAEELEQLISPVIAPTKAIAGVFNTVRSLVSDLNFLDGPLSVVADVLRPVEWAIDAVGFIFNTVVNPILNPVLNALGFNKLVQNIIDDLGLPSLNPFRAIETQLDKVADALRVDTGLVDQLKVDIDNYLARLTEPNGFLDVLAVEGSDGSELVVGDDLPPGNASANNLLDGLLGDDMIAGGAGDDTLLGGAGDDVLIGGEGNDVIDGGNDTVGRDTAVILAQFSQMVFQFDEQTETLIATHRLVSNGASDQGTDEIRNVESVVFLDRSFAFDDFGAVRYSSSTPTMPARLDGDEGGVPTRDFLFGSDGIDTINGLELDDYIEGRGGFDNLNGGNGNDLIEGGPGRDFIDGGAGIDTAVYRLGDGADPNFNRIDLLDDDNRRPFTADETPINVENLTGGDASDWFWGDNGANRLEGKDGNDKLVGFGGNDTLLGGKGVDQLVGGRGDDFVDGGQDRTVIIGGLGNDTVTSQDGLSTLSFAGNSRSWPNPFAATGVTTNGFAGLPDLGFTPEDLLTEIPQSVNVDMTAKTVEKFDAGGALIGTDTILNLSSVEGTQQADTFHGSALGETFYGGDGADTFTSEDARSDSVFDYYYGGGGDDTFDIGIASTYIDAGTGNDTLVYTDSEFGLTFLGGDDIDLMDLSNSAASWTIAADGEALGVLDGGVSEGGASYSLSLPSVENIIGSKSNDSISGSRTANLLDGGAGNDFLEAVVNADDVGGDTLIGGLGRDTLRAHQGNDLINGGDDADLITGGIADVPSSSSNNFAGGNDTMFGGDGNDTFVLLSGRNGEDPRYMIHGGDGVDEVDLSQWDTPYTVRTVGVYDPDGFNTLPDVEIILHDIEILRGTQFYDRYLGPQWANTYIGEGGDDDLNGRGGDDLLYGNEGNDSLTGGTGDDLIYGGVGHNILTGGSGIDTASFDPDMEGERDDGTPDWAPTLIDGVLDADLVRATATFAHTGGETYNNVLNGIENIIGTANDDTIRGDDKDNVLTGGVGDGADLLVGRGGDDKLNGGDGDDVLIGDSATFANVGMARLNEGAHTDSYLSDTNFDMPSGGAVTLEMLLQLQTVEHPNEGSAHATHSLVSYAVPGTDNELLVEAWVNDNPLRVWANGIFWDTPIPSSDLIDGDIHRLTVSFEAVTGFIEVYIDGQLRAAKVDSAMAAAMTPGGALIFGQEQDSVAGSFSTAQILRGGIGDIRIFDEIRSQGEVADNWDKTLADPANESRLVVNWQANAATQLVSDVTGNFDALTPSGEIRILSTGPDGDDILQGGAGDDQLIGNGGDDDLVGGAGTDTAIINVSRAEAIVHEVTRGIQIVSAEGADIIRQDVESVQFTDQTLTYDDLHAVAFAPIVPGTSNGETITGTIISEDMRGYGGADWIAPVGGNDTIDGGAGRDMLSFADLGETPGRENTNFRLDIDMEAGTAHSFDGTEQFTFSNIERVTGTIYSDVLRGTAGDDELRGIGDYDWFIATAGNDTITGGNGLDMITFVEWGGSGAAGIGDVFAADGAPPSGAAIAGLVFDLLDSSNNTGLAAGLTTESIERVTGSSYQDVFFGDENQNDFRGLGGFDWFVGSSGGRERYFGGDGIDTVTYFNATAGVIASLRNGADPFNGQETGYGSGGDAARDLYFEIENLVGTAFDDSLTGNNERNQLSGLDGDDFIFGYGGTDYMKGGAGDDTINGGAGSDFAIFDGNSADYDLVRDGNAVSVTGSDGTDLLIDVEYFRFDDGDLNIWSL
jgi:Ca2+-binding RTX toxin-like protein